MAVAMWLAAFNVKYRDVKYVLSFLVQIWMYATPVAYSSTTGCWACKSTDEKTRQRIEMDFMVV
jgi:ABC-type polysaccharide/polyol phosphate export permease